MKRRSTRTHRRGLWARLGSTSALLAMLGALAAPQPASAARLRWVEALRRGVSVSATGLHRLLPPGATALQRLKLLSLKRVAGGMRITVATSAAERQEKDALVAAARSGRSLSWYQRSRLRHYASETLLKYEAQLNRVAENREGSAHGGAAAATVRELAQLCDALDEPISDAEQTALKRAAYGAAIASTHAVVKRIAEQGDIDHAYLAARIENDLPQQITHARHRHQLELDAASLKLAAEIEAYYQRTRVLNEARIERDHGPVEAMVAEHADEPRKPRVPDRYTLSRLGPREIMRRRNAGEIADVPAEEVARGLELSFVSAISRQLREIRRVLDVANPFLAGTGQRAAEEIDGLTGLARSEEIDPMQARVAPDGLPDLPQLKRRLQELDAQRVLLEAEL